MANIALSLPQSDTDIDAGPVADNFSQIQAVINGGLDNSNIAASAGIPASKLDVSSLAIPKIAKGASVVTFSGSNTSDSLTVTHGLGILPTSVVLQISESGGTGPVNSGGTIVIWPDNIGATTFDVKGAVTNNLSFTGFWAFYWIAV